MHADPRLVVRVGGTTFASPVGLGWRVDPECRATRALARFGVGCIERLDTGSRQVVRGSGRVLCDGPRMAGAALSRRQDCRRSAEVDEVSLSRQEADDGGEVVALPSGAAWPVVAWDDEAVSVGRAVEAGGVVLQVGVREERGRWRAAGACQRRCQVVCRSRCGPGAHGWEDTVGLWSPGGVAGPADAVALVEAGANLVLVDAGLVFNGPGLVKRCNAAFVARCTADEAAEAGGLTEGPVMRRAWFWAAALGAALAGGGLLALVLSFGRVLLPYDEQFIGITVEELRRSLPQLHAFMAHDRGTLAGVMLGVGWLYAVVARQGIRHGVDGAKTAVVASALAGFASFFSFLGFGYFDPLHAFVAAVLFQLSVQLMVGANGGRAAVVLPRDDEDAEWRRAQWGQLCWVVHAVGLVLAGCVILAIGMTRVFVSEDLAFLCLDEAGARGLGGRVISVVAHDRATLGGMLGAAGVGMLLPVLWCHQRGASWLWWAVAGLGLSAYAATLGMHVWVGYTDWRHMLPALVGLALWAGGLGLSRRYLGQMRGRWMGC